MSNTIDDIIEILIRSREELHKKLLRESREYAELVRLDKAIEMNQALLVEGTIGDIVNSKPITSETSTNFYFDEDSDKEETILMEEFPTSGKRFRGKQLEFIVREVGHVMTKNEIEQRLEKRTGEKINTREALKRSLDLGMLVYVKFNNSRKFSFIGLPSWTEIQLDGKRRLRSEYAPDKKDLPSNLDFMSQTILYKNKSR